MPDLTDHSIAAKQQKPLSVEEEKIVDSWEYQLVGVLVHSGSADAGHYYSFIKERNR
jgi:ubiquitin C-terminal hydrolase